jgi:hypothetical protein
MFIFYERNNIVECKEILRNVQNHNIVMTIDEFHFGLLGRFTPLLALAVISPKAIHLGSTGLKKSGPTDCFFAGLFTGSLTGSFADTLIAPSNAPAPADSLNHSICLHLPHVSKFGLNGSKPSPK